MSEPIEGEPRFDKDHPFPARLRENRLLTRPGSEKETRHLVVDLAGSGLRYKAGDSLGVFPSNDPALVDEIVRRLGVGGDEPVHLAQSSTPVRLREALTTRLSLATPTRKTLALLATRATRVAERDRLGRLLDAVALEELAAFLKEREFVDLLAEFPSAKLAPQEFVEQLRRLVPRLYSIASSPVVHPEEAYLTVAVVRYDTNGRRRHGVCSSFLADRVGEGSPVPVFTAHSHFGPPEDEAADLIMVGPGTGIAPFRAFLEERAVRGARGRNWLFFGEQRRAFDFLYEEELLAWQRQGVLTRLDTAFSRDQAHKIYVQDRMRENAPELWRWLEGGASFLVCGDAKYMAKDVDRALHEIAAEHGRMDAVQATEFVKALRRDGRYRRDVY